MLGLMADDNAQDSGEIFDLCSVRVEILEIGSSSDSGRSSTPSIGPRDEAGPSTAYVRRDDDRVAFPDRILDVPGSTGHEDPSEVGREDSPPDTSEGDEGPVLSYRHFTNLPSFLSPSQKQPGRYFDLPKDDADTVYFVREHHFKVTLELRDGQIVDVVHSGGNPNP